MSDPGARSASLLQKHFPKFGTFRKKCTYVVVGVSVYNAAAGTTTPVVVSTHTNLYIIFDEFGFTETQAQQIQPDETRVMSVDRKAVFPSLDLSVTPSVNDEITDEGGQKWRVMGLSNDPKPAHHALHVRPIG